MSTMKELLERARGDTSSGDFLSEMVAAIPYMGFLGISFDTSSGDLIGKMRFKDELVGNQLIPALHGGTVAALLESTAMFKLFYAAETDAVPKIINNTVSYLRTGRAVDTYARAVIYREGRRIASVRATAWQDDPERPIAASDVHVLLQ